MGDDKLPDYLVLLSTLGGFIMFGMDGFVSGPIVAVLFVTVWQIFMKDKRDLCEGFASENTACTSPPEAIRPQFNEEENETNP